MEYTKKYHNWGILLLRIGIGMAFVLVYGYPLISGGTEVWTKLGSAMGNLGINFAPEFWGFMSALTQFGGGILLVFGLLTRPVAFFMGFNMVVAMTQHFTHKDPWNIVILPIMLISVFVSLLLFGGGRFSLD